MKMGMVVAVLFLAMSNVHADEWRIGLGPSYLSGFNEVTDLHDDNLEWENYSTVDSFEFPIGLAFDAHYQYDSGLRVGFGVGPISLILGDAELIELALNATVGYAFFPQSNVSPYIRVGLAHHMASGDYVVDSEPGTIVALGLEFARKSRVTYSFEVSADDSEVTYESVGYTSCPFYFSDCRLRQEVKLNSYDLVMSFFIKF